MSIMDHVKTYEDACKILEFEPMNFGRLEKDEVAYIKMKTIIEALNEGWYPKFMKGEYRGFPWCHLYTEKEISKLDQKNKDSIILFRNNTHDNKYHGIAYANQGSGWSSSDAGIGSHLALKSEELAIYFGKQFTKLIINFVCP